METVPGTDIEKPIVTGPIDGNAFAIMGIVRKALRMAKVPKEVIDKYLAQATSGDYNHLLAISQNYVEFDL